MGGTELKKPVGVLAAIIPLTFLAIFFVWPVGTMLLHAFRGDGGDVSGVATVLTGRTWKIFAQTIWMAVAGTVGSVLLGVPGAYVLYRLAFPGRRVLRAIAAVPFALPSVVVGVAFRALLSEAGPLGFLGLDGTTTAVVAAFIFFNFSVIVRTVGSMWQSLDPRAEEAAQTLGASRWRAFRTVTLPQLGPSIAAGGALVFLFCSTSFGVVQTLGRPGYGTLESEIYVQAKTFLDFRTAAVLSLLQIGVVALALIASSVLTARTESSLSMRASGERPVTRRDLPIVLPTLIMTLALIMTPLAALAAGSLRSRGEWTLHNFRVLGTAGEGFTGGTSVLEAINNSVRIAADAMWIALLVGVPLAFVLSRRVKTPLARAGQQALDGALLLPLGVSAVTVGFGYLIAFNGTALGRSPMIVPLAQAVVALPLVVRSLVPLARAIDPRMREAAATLGASPGRVLRTIDVPFMLRGFGLAAGFAFALSLGEFGATSFLADPDMQTLPVLINRLLGRPGADNYGMALAGAAILALLTASVMALAEFIRPRGTGRRPLPAGV